MLVACMAGLLDTGQEIATYLLFHIIPILIYHIIYLVLPEDPMSFRILAKTIAKTSAWRLRGHPCNARPKQIKCFKKLKKKWLAKQFKTKQSSKSSPLTLCRHYLQPSRLVVASKKKIRHFLRPIHRAPRFLALQGALLDNPAVRFDSDSFSIGIDNHASRCMANAPHLFPLRGSPPHQQCRGGKWDRQRVSYQTKRDIHVLTRGRQRKKSHNQDPKQSLFTWFKAMPPVTTTLGAGGR